MFNHILVAFQELFKSPALATEVQNLEADFRDGLTLNFIDANGKIVVIQLNSPQPVNGFAHVTISQPPRRIGNTGAPFPSCYLYHLQSEYPEKEQEADIVCGKHKWGVSIYASGNLPEDAENASGRLAVACKKLIERNQYVFGAIPRVHGAASLTEVHQIVPNERGATTVMAHHLVVTTKLKELRVEI